MNIGYRYRKGGEGGWWWCKLDCGRHEPIINTSWEGCIENTLHLESWDPGIQGYLSFKLKISFPHVLQLEFRNNLLILETIIISSVLVILLLLLLFFLSCQLFVLFLLSLLLNAVFLYFSSYFCNIVFFIFLNFTFFRFSFIDPLIP